MFDLIRVIRHHVRFATTHRHLVNVYQHEERSLVDPWKRQFTRRRQQYVRRWETIVGRCAPGADSGRTAVATQAVLGLIFSIALWPAKLAGTPDLGDIVVDLVLQGLPSLDN